ncbi:translation initiation factor IF-2 N-terminal domain-containing protein [candidate division KSB1 bacterium]
MGKIRIFKLAKELNIASDSLISFLNEAGYDVSSVNSPVDEEMYEKVMDQFDVEKDLAEKKETLRIKRAVRRGEIDITAATAETEAATAEEKKIEKAKRPAILEAIDTLKKTADQKKDEPEEPKPEKPKKKGEKKSEEIAEKIEEVKEDAKIDDVEALKREEKD